MSTFCNQFTNRQIQITKLIDEEGLTNAEIANRLGLATSTIKNELNVMLALSGASNRVKLAIMMRKENCFDTTYEL